MAQIPDCSTLNIANQDLKVTLPGGACIPTMVPEVIPNDVQVTKALLGQTSAALAPLVPIFNIIDMLLAVQAFAEAVPDSLGPPPDPSALSSALSDLGRTAAVIASLIPQLSIPLMVVGLLDLAIASTNGIVGQLEALLLQESRTLAAETQANNTNNPDLLAIVLCSRDINETVRNGINESQAPIGAFFGVTNVFLGLIGAEPIPAQSGGLPSDTQAAIDQQRALVGTLETVRAAIPIP